MNSNDISKEMNSPVMKSYVLDVHDLHSKFIASQGIMSGTTLTLQQTVDIGADQLYLELVAYIAKQRQNQIVYPADWKEAFKDRWFPKWLKRIFPVHFFVYNVDVYFPSIPTHSDKTFVRFEALGRHVYTKEFGGKTRG
jgi:hypothetical protein